MHCQPECYACLENLARRCASLAAAEEKLRREALELALLFLGSELFPGSAHYRPGGGVAADYPPEDQQ